MTDLIKITLFYTYALVAFLSAIGASVYLLYAITAADVVIWPAFILYPLAFGTYIIHNSDFEWFRPLRAAYDAHIKRANDELKAAEKEYRRVKAKNDAIEAQIRAIKINKTK